MTNDEREKLNKIYDIVIVSASKLEAIEKENIEHKKIMQRQDEAIKHLQISDAQNKTGLKVLRYIVFSAIPAILAIIISFQRI